MAAPAIMHCIIGRAASERHAARSGKGKLIRTFFGVQSPAGAKTKGAPSGAPFAFSDRAGKPASKNHSE
jgi:hypothetical protein